MQTVSSLQTTARSLSIATQSRAPLQHERVIKDAAAMNVRRSAWPSPALIAQSVTDVTDRAMSAELSSSRGRPSMAFIAPSVTDVTGRAINNLLAN